MEKLHSPKEEPLPNGRAVAAGAPKDKSTKEEALKPTLKDFQPRKSSTEREIASEEGGNSEGAML